MPRPLAEFVDPLLKISWGELGAIGRQANLDDGYHVEVALGYPIDGVVSEYEYAARDWLGDPRAHTDFKFVPPAHEALPGVKHVIAVASGKGGVGKSTTAVNLALGLARAGAQVGLLDADIYGPSQGLMLGIEEGRRPQVVDGKFFEPITSYGIQAISMSMLASDRTPMVWRGPMASGALQQLLKQTKWRDLDYLIVDMPPGTGDIQLTLSQAVSVGGVLIVTTPQEIALSDARKGIEMFAKVNVPILGIIENMSYFICDECSAKHHIFDAGGGEKVANEYDTKLIAALPLATAIREQTDGGFPTVVADTNGELGQTYIRAARLTAARMWQVASKQAPSPSISMSAI